MSGLATPNRSIQQSKGGASILGVGSSVSRNGQHVINNGQQTTSNGSSLNGGLAISTVDGIASTPTNNNNNNASHDAFYSPAYVQGTNRFSIATNNLDCVDEEQRPGVVIQRPPPESSEHSLHRTEQEHRHSRSHSISRRDSPAEEEEQPHQQHEHNHHDHEHDHHRRHHSLSRSQSRSNRSRSPSRRANVASSSIATTQNITTTTQHDPLASTLSESPSPPQQHMNEESSMALNVAASASSSSIDPPEPIQSHDHLLNIQPLSLNDSLPIESTTIHSSNSLNPATQTGAPTHSKSNTSLLHTSDITFHRTPDILDSSSCSDIDELQQQQYLHEVNINIHDEDANGSN